MHLSIVNCMDRLGCPIPTDDSVCSGSLLMESYFLTVTISDENALKCFIIKATMLPVSKSGKLGFFEVDESILKTA